MSAFFLKATVAEFTASPDIGPLMNCSISSLAMNGGAAIPAAIAPFFIVVLLVGMHAP